MIGLVEIALLIFNVINSSKNVERSVLEKKSESGWFNL